MKINEFQHLMKHNSVLHPNMVRGLSPLVDLEVEVHELRVAMDAIIDRAGVRGMVIRTAVERDAVQTLLAMMLNSLTCVANDLGISLQEVATESLLDAQHRRVEAEEPVLFRNPYSSIVLNDFGN